MVVLIENSIFVLPYTIDLIMVSEAILRGRQPLDKLQCLYGNLMSDNFRKTAVRKKKGIVKLSLTAKDCTNNLLGPHLWIS